MSDILSILKIKLNSFVNFFTLLYNTDVEEKEKNTKKTKKSKKNKKSIIILILVTVGIVLALTACLLAVFLSIPKNGEEIQILSYDHQVFVKTDVKEKERTYRFKFECESDMVEIDSDSNVLDITQKLYDDELHLGTTYDVSVCLVEPAGILAGEYGKVKTFTPTLSLRAPEISLNAEDGKTLSWQAVEHADYYTVCYYNVSTLEKVTVSGTEFDITSLLGGERQIFVTSHSNRKGLNESEKSNAVEATIVHGLQNFVRATVDRQTKQVNIVSAENVGGIVLTDVKNGCDYRIVNFTSVKTTEGYAISFNIGLIFVEEDQTFLVRPLDDVYNIFTGEATELLVS